MYQERDSKWARILYNKYLNVYENTSLFRTRNLPRGSIAWNFLMKFRPLITKYTTWDVGKGDKALF